MRFAVVLLVLLAGCQSDNAYDIVRDKASEDLRCPKSQIQVHYQGSLPADCPMTDGACREREESSTLLLAQGCGAVRIYRCDSHRDATFGETRTTCSASTSVQQM